MQLRYYSFNKFGSLSSYHNLPKAQTPRLPCYGVQPTFDYYKKIYTKAIDFTLPFLLQRSSNQSLAEEKGVLGALGKAAVFANSEKSEYQIKVDTHMEGSMFSISDTQEIRFA